jgi:MFS family permease
MSEDFGLNHTVTSGIFSVYMGFSAIFSIIGGWSLDKKGPKFTIAMMGILTGLGLLITSQVHETWQLYLSYSLVLAAGTGETFTVTSAFVSRWFKKKRGLALGIAGMGAGLGPMIFAPLATFIIINSSWREAFIALGVISLLVVVVSALFLKGYPEDIGLLRDGEKPPVVNGKPVLQKPGLRGFTLKQAFKTSTFWYLFFIWIFHGAAAYLVMTHLVPHSIDNGISVMIASTIISVLSGFTVLGGLSAGWLSAFG